MDRLDYLRRIKHVVQAGRAMGPWIGMLAVLAIIIASKACGG